MHPSHTTPDPKNTRADRTLNVARIIRDRMNFGQTVDEIRDDLVPGYVSELDASMARLAGFIDAAGRDHRAVDPDAFHRAKEELDRLSVRVHEVAIARSLRGVGTGGPDTGSPAVGPAPGDSR